MKAVDQNFTSLVGGQALVEEDQGLPLFLRLDQVQRAGLDKQLKTGSAQPECNLADHFPFQSDVHPLLLALPH